MAYGIKVSQTGHDVKTCDDKDLVFSSDWNTPKIIGEGSAFLNVGSGQNGEITVNHNYGMVGVLAFADLKEENKFTFLDGSGIVSDPMSGNEYNSSSMEISATQLKFNIYNRCGSNRTFHIYYKFLREQS